MSLFSELRNRNVFRVAAAYVVSAWLLIQVVETIFPAFGFGQDAVRIVVIVAAIGLVPVLVFAWLFEITPEGIRRESEIDRSGPVAAATSSRLNRAIIILLTLAVGFFAFDKFVLEPARDAELERSTTERVRSEALVESFGESSIAVLPFRNMSGDPENEYFSDGISEELLNLLAKIPRLRVISRSSSFTFRDQELTIPEVAERLRVAYVLEGSVRKAGGKVRITAQLIEGRSDTHLWSETYDRSIDDVFAIQDEIGAAIVAELRGKLGLEIGEAPRVTSTANPEAHDAALRGWHLFAQRLPGSKGRAAAEFEKALALDPGFALAHAGLAFSYMLGGCTDLEDNECNARVEHHVTTALELDPNLAEAHAAKAYSLFGGEHVEEARIHYRRALEINPNYATVYVWMANTGLFTNPQEAFEAYRKAASLDPLSPVTNHSWILTLIGRGRLTEALEQIERYAAIDPLSAIVLRGEVAAVGGNTAERINAALEALSSGGEALTYRWFVRDILALGLAEIGLGEEALRLNTADQVLFTTWFVSPEAGIALGRKRRSEHPGDPEFELHLMLALAHTGNYGEARPYLERGWQHYRHWILGMVFRWYEMLQVQALIGVLRDAGDEAGATQVLEEFTGFLRDERAAGVVGAELDFLEGIAAWLSGERERGLALMSAGVAQGYWIRPPAAYQQPMYDDPGFAPLLEQQRIRQAREREKVLKFACADDYPYADVWQPMPETCELFTATQLR